MLICLYSYFVLLGNKIIVQRIKNEIYPIYVNFIGGLYDLTYYNIFIIIRQIFEEGSPACSIVIYYVMAAE